MNLLHKSAHLGLSAGMCLYLGVTMTNAGDLVPFKSKGEITVDYSLSDFSKIPATVIATDTGTATHLGRFTSDYWVQAYPDADPDAGLVWVYNGVFTSITASGDSLTVALWVAGPFDGVNLPTTVSGTATILSGTGRFANTTGSWEATAVTTPTGGFIYESVGTISNPGKAKP